MHPVLWRNAYIPGLKSVELITVIAVAQLAQENMYRFRAVVVECSGSVWPGGERQKERIRSRPGARRCHLYLYLISSHLTSPHLTSEASKRVSQEARSGSEKRERSGKKVNDKCGVDVDPTPSSRSRKIQIPTTRLEALAAGQGRGGPGYLASDPGGSGGDGGVSPASRKAGRVRAGSTARLEIHGGPPENCPAASWSSTFSATPHPELKEPPGEAGIRPFDWQSRSFGNPGLWTRFSVQECDLRRGRNPEL
ncbi:unnamed protein product [Diplocarpon coronariae]